MSTAALLSGIRDGNYHVANGTRCLQLLRLGKEYFEALREEVLVLTRSERGSDVTDPSHVTYWTRPSGEAIQYSLYNTSGRYDDYSTDHDWRRLGKQFFGAGSYPRLAKLLAQIPDPINFRINILGAGAQLSPHEEHSIVRMSDGAIVGRLRFHLPVVTERGAELTLDGNVYHLEAGVIYFINHGCVHSARNGGRDARIHLVWDVLLSQAAYDCLFGESAWSLPVARFPDHARPVTPGRTQPVSTYLRIPPSVTREEAEALQLWIREHSQERRHE